LNKIEVKSRVRLERKVVRVLCTLWNFVSEFDKLRQQKGGGVVWNYLPYESPVIPAKAGIQPVEWDKPEELRSGFPPSRE
jgi:hypothetical protein